MDAKYKFSVYHAPIKNITPFKHITLEDVHKVIISNKYKTITETLRNTTNKNQQNEFKASTLDYVTFSGVFAERTTTGLLQHSNLFCIDLDNLNSVGETKSKVLEMLPPSLMFVSPTGKGLKLVYKINIEAADHLRYYFAFEHFFKQQMNLAIDDKCKDIPRACFLCYDSEAILNNDAETIEKSFIDTFCTDAGEVPQKTPIEAAKETLIEHDAIIDNLKTWLNKRECFVPGNRNNYITQLAGAYNRYGIPKTVAERDLITYAENGFTEAEIKATVRSIYSNTSYHNTASFDTNTPYEFAGKKVEEKYEAEHTPLLPIEGFPEYLQEFINEYVAVYNVPRDYIAASVLFSTALAIGNKLELKGKYDNIPLLWLAIVGNVSSGKTEPLKTCLGYFTNKDKAAFDEYQQKLRIYNTYNELGKKEKVNTEPVEQPEYFQYILNDYTPEALYNVHAINNRGICIYRDELKGWLDDFGRYNKSGEQSTILSTFYRQPMQINRASKEPIYIHKPCIYISGGIQPDILPDLAKDNRAENGFLSRLMFAYPDLSHKQPYSKAKLNTGTLLGYHKYLGALDSLAEIVDLVLNDEAETLYSDWYNSNAEKTNNEPAGYLKGVYGKLDVFCLRLAIVVHGMRFVCCAEASTEINARTMSTAIELSEYFRATALKVYHRIFKHTSNSVLDKKEVARYCNSLGASQNEIAAALKVSQQYVQKILKQ